MKETTPSSTDKELNITTAEETKITTVIYDMKEIELPNVFQVDEYANYMAHQELNKEIDIATEIYISTNYTRMNYSELMNDIDEGLATKDMLTSWLNDSVRNGQVSRPGIITLYRFQFQKQFTDGKWNPRYFVNLINFAFERLIDVSFMKDKKKVELFEKSIKDKKWFHGAVGVIGLKMLEYLFKKNALISDAANNHIGANYMHRKMLESFAKIAGRVAKNNNMHSSDMNELKYSIEKYHREYSNQLRERTVNSLEHKIYEKHKAAIEAGMGKVRNKLALGDGQ